MELNVNSPAYYKDNHGMDDRVYHYCQGLYRFFQGREYSPVLKTIGIVPVIAPEDVYAKGLWKEEIRFLSKSTVASVVIRMDYESYLNASDGDRIKMYRDMILEAVKRIKGKGKFDMDSFRKDLVEFTRSWVAEE